MASDQHIKNYTAADIERYHRGVMSPSEQHELEKASLEDPFLADAIEGYGDAGVNVSEDLADLQTRLDSRTSETPVVLMADKEKKSF